MAIRVHLQRLALVVSAAAGIAIVAAPACAQSTPSDVPISVSWSKSDAILGAPSALQAILAQQNAIPAAPTTLRPAAYSLPKLAAIVRDRLAVSEGVLSGRPDVFGSVALRVAHTPLDGRWRRVESAPVDGAPARLARALRSLGSTDRLQAVNRYVNHRVRYVEDEIQWGRADVWSTANQTLSSGRGDCEDYAIAKLQMLRAAGFAKDNLYLVVLRDLVRRADHAVLVVRATGHMYVLDNGTDQLLDSEAVSDYRPILTFAANGAWTHGYRVQPAPVYVSENAGAVFIPAGDQRSRSASLLAFNTGFIR